MVISMALVGQASGDFTEGSSALRILHKGIMNSIGVLTNDAFTQSNPSIVTGATTISTQLTQLSLNLKRGVLSGSVAFARPDQGSNYVGGPVTNAVVGTRENIRALGCFINDAGGHNYENLPGQASGKGPYVSANGTFGNALFETQVLISVGGSVTAADALTYTAGMNLVASRNGFLMPSHQAFGGTWDDIALGANAGEANTLEGANSAAVTVIGVLKVPSDAVLGEIVYDQRI